MGLAQSVRETSASEILSFATHLVEKTEKLSVNIEQRLNPVLLGTITKSDTAETKKEKPYPPFFNELKSKLDSISRILDDIEDCIRRVDL